jgi:hypothetical protein
VVLLVTLTCVQCAEVLVEPLVTLILGLCAGDHAEQLAALICVLCVGQTIGDKYMLKKIFFTQQSKFKVWLLAFLSFTLIGCEKPQEPQQAKKTISQCEIGRELTWDGCIGSIRYSNGDEYTGGFKSGKFSGQGKYVLQNGDKYEGEFKNGLRNGYGVFTFSDGENYKGEWLDAKKHGKGEYNYADGRRFRGYFENEKRINGQEFNASGELSKEWIAGVLKYIIPEFTLACRTGGGGAFYRIASKNGEIYFASIVNQLNILASKKSFKIEVQEREILVEMKEGDSELPHYLEIDRSNLYSIKKYFVSRDLYPPDGFSTMGMTCQFVDEPDMFNILKQGYESTLSEGKRKKQEYDSRPNKI